jgi:hypothetical protein
MGSFSSCALYCLQGKLKGRWKLRGSEGERGQDLTGFTDRHWDRALCLKESWKTTAKMCRFCGIVGLGW